MKTKSKKISSSKYVVVASIALVFLLGLFTVASADVSFKELLAEKMAVVMGEKLSASLGFESEILGGQVHNTRETFAEGIEIDKGITMDTYIFDTVATSFADATVTPCAILNDDGADRWVMAPFAAITSPATTTLTFTFATSTTPYKGNASTAVISMKVSTSTETAVGLPSYNSNAGIASGVFKWPDGTYLLLNVSGENATLEKAAWETNNTLDGRCVVQYIKE